MASIPTETRQWILTNPPTDEVRLTGPSPTFTLHTNPLPSLGPDQILLKGLYYSNDPAQRAWIQKDRDPKRFYTTPVVAGDVMRAGAVCEVLASNSEKYKVGAHVRGLIGWSEYAVKDAKDCPPIQDVPGLSETHFLGALGTTGLTAYYGIKIIARVGPDDTVVVSGAAGATGSMVVQIAKNMLGCKRVVATAGTDEKCRWVESLGADVCLNYKAKNFRERLLKETEDFVDVFFDNVGGDVLNTMMTRMKVGGRITVCGVISSYNDPEKMAVQNWFEVVSSRLEIRGFIVTDFYQQGGAAEATKEMIEAYKAGKVKIGAENETVVETKFEAVPKTWMRLFEGANTGKLVSKLA